MLKPGRTDHPTHYSPGISGVFAVSLQSHSEDKSSACKRKKKKTKEEFCAKLGDTVSKSTIRIPGKKVSVGCSYHRVLQIRWDCVQDWWLAFLLAPLQEMLSCFVCSEI